MIERDPVLPSGFLVRWRLRGAYGSATLWLLATETAAEAESAVVAHRSDVQIVAVEPLATPAAGELRYVVSAPWLGAPAGRGPCEICGHHCHGDRHSQRRERFVSSLGRWLDIGPTAWGHPACLAAVRRPEIPVIDYEDWATERNTRLNQTEGATND